MKMSNLFGETLREVSAETDAVSHQLLVRAGFIRQLGAGIFSYLHLANRSITKIETILREEMNKIGGQEITMPVVHPADIWKETERWFQIGSEMGRFVDKNGRDMVLAMTHEEVVADLVRREIHSYKQLPRLLYQIQTKWRDDPRPRAGLIRVREFTMKDSYSLDADWEGLDRQYRSHYQSYFDIFHRCDLPVLAVKSDVGMMGGKIAHEFMYLSSIGEDTLIICDDCGYTANRQIAKFRKPKIAEETPQSMKKVVTPGTKTIEDVSKFLGITTAKIAKAFFAVATITEHQLDVSKLIIAIVRGDMDVNETKLANAVSAKELRPAHDEEIRESGAIPGYASPIDLHNVLIVVDDIIPESPNLVYGANEENHHILNVNYGRDYTASIVTDIAVAEEGFECPNCGNLLYASRGIEVGNIFKLGTHYSDSMGCKYLDKDGKAKPVIMGSYGIGVGRLLGCLAEEHHDNRGLVWPITVAPYQIHLVALKGGQEAADSIYTELTNKGFEVLFDDRDERVGVKLNDADLIGIPIRVTLSERSIKEGGAELKIRKEENTVIVSLDQILNTVMGKIQVLENEISKKVVEVEYKE